MIIGVVCGCTVCMWFFFTQTEAYEMRISDWSSDVCSSDLKGRDLQSPCRSLRARRRGPSFGFRGAAAGRAVRRRGDGKAEKGGRSSIRRSDRSEEYTSELQSLMRISYAVFCLKKKKHTYTKNQHYILQLIYYY